MGWGQRIATMALLLLVLIAAVACLGGKSESTKRPSAEFTSQSYTSSASSTSSDASKSGGSSTSASSDRSSGSAGRATPSAYDGLGVVAFADLPKQGRNTIRLIDRGGPFPYPRDGVVFSNRERILPYHPRGWYHEYTVPTPGESDRGARRIVKGKDGTLYYSSDHYQSFRRVTR